MYCKLATQFHCDIKWASAICCINFMEFVHEQLHVLSIEINLKQTNCKSKYFQENFAHKESGLDYYNTEKEFDQYNLNILSQEVLHILSHIL